MTVELTLSPAQMLAGIANAAGASVSTLTHSEAALIGAWYAATVGGSSPHLTMSVPSMLAAIRNALSDDPDATAANTSVGALLAQINNALSDEADLSQATSSVDQLLASIFTLTVSDGGGGGEALIWTDPDNEPWTAPTDGEWTKPE